jgi:hypothetical protein
MSVSLGPGVAPIVKERRMSTPTITEALTWINIDGSGLSGFHLSNLLSTFQRTMKANDMIIESGIIITTRTVSLRSGTISFMLKRTFVSRR